MGWGPFPPFLRDDHLTQAQRADAVRWFLELNGFIMNFAELTSPLTNLTRKCESDLVHWQSSAKEALNSIWLGKINSLGITMLHSPNFSLRAGGRFVFAGEGIRLRYTSVVSCQSARLNTAQQIKNVWQFCRQLKPTTVISWYADSPYVRAMFCRMMAPLHEGCQHPDHPTISSLTAFQIHDDPKAWGIDGCGWFPLLWAKEV